jgi:hypothetical protein
VARWRTPGNKRPASLLFADNYKVTLNSLDSTYQFSGTATGSIFGTNVSDKIAYMAFETLVGKGTPGSKSQEALNKSLGPQQCGGWRD